MLTFKKLKYVSPGIFKSGVINNEKYGEVKWVAVRGQVPDWAIYIGPKDKDIEWIAKNGNKLFDLELTQILIPCDKKVLEHYRV